jgi:hypothetical protein
MLWSVTSTLGHTLVLVITRLQVPTMVWIRIERCMKYVAVSIGKNLPTLGGVQALNRRTVQTAWTAEILTT